MNSYLDNDSFANENPWIELPAGYWDSIIADLTPTTYGKNQIIFHQGDQLDYVYIFKTGRAHVSYYGAQGELKCAYVAEVNCMIGEGVALPGYTAYYTATAIVASEVYVIPIATLKAKLSEDGDFALKVINLMARKMRIHSAMQIELSFREAYTRICNVIYYIAQTYGTIDEYNHIRVGIRFTHQEIASMVNTSRVSVANVFSELRQKDIVVRENGLYVIRNMAALVPKNI